MPFEPCDKRPAQVSSTALVRYRRTIIRRRGFRPRRDLSGYHAADWDLRIADLHYRDLCEWAVGRNAAAGWDAAEDRAGIVKGVWTDPLPPSPSTNYASASMPNVTRALKSASSFGVG